MRARPKKATGRTEDRVKIPKVKVEGDFIGLPCIPVKQGGTTLYLLSAPARILWSVLSINKREPDKNQGYQRALSSSRVASISKYLSTNNQIPTGLVVSFDGAKFTESPATLQIPNRPDAGWVIDGQHRLAGAHEADSSFELPVVAFLDLPLERQIEQFVTINKEAKGVPTSLYLDLLKHLPPAKSEAEMARERAADLATQLRLDEESAFSGKIVILGAPRKGEISLNNFVRKISSLVHPSKGRLGIYTGKEQKKIIDNYYKGLSHAFPTQYDRQDSVFFQTLGFGALFNAFPTAFDLTVKHCQGFRAEDVAQLLKRIDYFDFDQWRQLGTGNAAESEAGNNLRQELLNSLSSSSEGEVSSIRL